jgi:hypothetical protein
MSATPLMQKVLGDNWHHLPPVIQRHYQLQDDYLTAITVIGTMYVNYPKFVWPMLFITRLMGGLIDMKGNDMSARVEKWIKPDKPDTLFWKRTIHAGNGKSIYLPSGWNINKAMN